MLTRLEPWWQDVRHASRGLWRARAFAGAAVLTLAAGLAGTTTMFALVEGVLLRPLPVRAQDALIVAWKELRGSGFAHYPFRVSQLDVIRRESRTLARVAGADYQGASGWTTIENGVASDLQGTAVTGEYFDVLGITPLLGRAFTAEDDRPGAEGVLVISHGLWQRRYGGARDAIGRRLTVRERPFTIVGVMPSDIDYQRGVEAWMPLTALQATIANPAFVIDVDLIARLRPGVMRAQAASELQALTTRFEADASPNAPRGLSVVLRSYADATVGDVRTTMLALFGAVGLVLLIASANVANLLLLRGDARRSELAIRAALGAGRWRLIRQILVESILLALAAALVGVTITAWTLRALVAIVPDGLPRIDAIRLDAGVILFALAVAIVTALLAGLAPALASAGVDLASPLRSGGRGGTGRTVRHGRRALVVAQVALAVTVVAAAGLLTRSLLRLQSVDLGLAADRLVFVNVDLPGTTYDERERHLQFLREAAAALGTAPGIAAATPVNVLPFSGVGGWDVPLFTAEGQGADRAALNPSLNLEGIFPNYFETFGVAIVRGRGFTDADRQGAPEVAIVSEDVAARTWPGDNPIGKRLKLGPPTSKEPWRTVVGVARPTRYRDLTRLRATLYLPTPQFVVASERFVVRTALPLTQVAALARARLQAVDPDVPVTRVAPFADLLAAPLSRPRFNAFVIGLFGVAALLLAGIGLYAVMAAYVRQREREIGIRVALGATRADVRGLVLGEGLRLAGAGAAIGFAGAIAVSRLLRGLLFDVHPLDPASMIAAALLLVGVSALASYLPARRAARTDPIATLRAC